MKFDQTFGPAAPEHGWIPAPRYLMRRSRILSLVKGVSAGRLLEIGCGTGLLLHELQRQGFRCTGVESSSEALLLARKLGQESPSIRFHSAHDTNWAGAFDVVCSFDVLEHIQDDRAALLEWATLLRPGGHLLISVPARQKLWTAGDEWAGHFRRYERQGLMELLASAGFLVDRFECYGFPLTNLSERIGAKAYERRLRTESKETTSSRSANNDRSGVDRRQLLKLYPLMISWPGRTALRFFMQFQRAFLATDLGTGYLVRAVRA